jgi:hypothetical protein
VTSEVTGFNAAVPIAGNYDQHGKRQGRNPSIAQKLKRVTCHGKRRDIG